MIQVKVGLFCLNSGLEIPHIAGAVAMSPNNQHVKKNRQSGLDDIALGVFYDFKQFPKIECQTRLVCANHPNSIYIALRYVFGFGGYSF